MEAFFVSTALVAVAEIGDKTQLLALMLAARYRKPLPIILGILCATLANHALAAWIGAEVAAWVGPETMRWILAVTFIVMAGWCLIPDKADEGPQAARKAGAFLATLVAFFLVEIGDKTQIATVALAARFESLTIVTARHHARHADRQRACRAVRRRHRQAPAAQDRARGRSAPVRGAGRGCDPYARWPLSRADALARPISGRSLAISGPVSRAVSARRSGWNSARPLR